MDGAMAAAMRSLADAGPLYVLAFASVALFVWRVWPLDVGGGWTYSTSFDGVAAPWTRAYPAGLFCAPPTVNVNVKANRCSSASPSGAADAAKVAVGVFAYGVLSDMTLHVRAAGRWK